LRKHRHLETVLAAARTLGFARLLDRELSRERDLCRTEAKKTVFACAGSRKAPGSARAQAVNATASLVDGPRFPRAGSAHQPW
jgi:hypothetical protein